MQILGNFINGNNVESQSGRVGAVYDPATGEQTKQVCLSSAQETAQAITAAHDALAEWSAVTPLNRSRVMFKFKALLEENKDELARLITSEHGKVFQMRREN